MRRPPKWVLIGGGVIAAWLAWRWWKGRSQPTPDTSIGLQPIASPLATKGTPLGGGAVSASAVSTPTGNGLGSTTVGTAALRVRGPSYVPQPVKIGGTTYSGQLTEGGKGETEYFSDPGQLVGGGTWHGPGLYTRLKMPPTDAGGGPNTIWLAGAPG